MKYYLLIAGYSYYPGTGTDDWRGCFETYQEAENQVTKKDYYRTITKGKDKGKQEVTHWDCEINGTKYDWYEIVDLMPWMRK